MSFHTYDFKGFRAEQLKAFCRAITDTKNSTDLVNLVAGDAHYLGYCRKITHADKTSRKMFTVFCRQNRMDSRDIQFKVCKVATVLGIYKQADYYGILDVRPDADNESIKKAYRKKAKFLHPDMLVGQEGSNEEFIQLQTAYMHLSDPEFRKVYDTMVKDPGGADLGGTGGRRPKRGYGRLINKACVVIGVVVIAGYAIDGYLRQSSDFDAASNVSARYAFPIPTDKNTHPRHGDAISLGPEMSGDNKKPDLLNPVDGRSDIGGGVPLKGDTPSVLNAKGADIYRTAAHRKKREIIAASGFQKQRVLAFLDAYTEAYEKKELNTFKSFFAEDALEQGEPFGVQIAKYQKTFRGVERLEYNIVPVSVLKEKGRDKIVADGYFEARYRQPGKGWGATKGSIRMEFSDGPDGLLISRMDYEMTD